MMQISSLASGSSGNSFLIKGNNNSILIDAGISCRQVIERMTLLGESPKNLKAIFITHEHSDHIKGADVLSRTFKIPIYSTKETSRNCLLCSNPEQIVYIKNKQITKVGNMEIESIPKSHDCPNPVSFKISSTSNKRIISIITDLGKLNKDVLEAINDSDFLAIEANHDRIMLENGPYPYFLKKRIAGEKGHLSNEKSAIAVLENANRKLQSILLCHLSENNNTPKIAFRTFNNFVNLRKDLTPKIQIAPRYTNTELLEV